MARAVLKMPYRRRQEDQPSVEYPSDVEEDRLALGNSNSNISNGKISFKAATNVRAGGLEIEDELTEIDDDMFAIPSKRSQKNSSKGNLIDAGFTTDFTTTVLGMIFDF